jgi:F-type H+-transporting ATPase subunit b
MAGEVLVAQGPVTVHPTEGAHPAPGELHAGTEVAAEAHGAGSFPPFDTDTFAAQLIWLALTFGFLYFVMSRVALPRIGNIIDQRKARIDGDLAAADHARKKTDEAIAAYEGALAEARAKAHAMAEETRNGIRSDIDSRRRRVEEDLAAKVAAAEATIQASKVEALGKVDEIAAETVQALVTQLSGPVSIGEARDAVASVGKE